MMKMYWKSMIDQIRKAETKNRQEFKIHMDLVRGRKFRTRNWLAEKGKKKGNVKVGGWEIPSGYPETMDHFTGIEQIVIAPKRKKSKSPHWHPDPP